MPDHNEDPNLARAHLVAVLEELCGVLARVGETWWTDWLRARLLDLKSSGLDGVTRLLAGYGGMGSCNDLALHPLNGHRLNPEEIDPINAIFNRLRSRAYELAFELARTVE